MKTMTLAEQISTPTFKKQFNLDLFTRVAHEYDLATRMMSLGGDARWKQMLVEALPDHTAPHCVDVACGTGDVTLELARRYPDGNIIGLDLTPAMIDVAKARATGSHNVQFRVTDMCKTGLPDSSVDMVTGSYALRNAPTLTDALAEIHRILKPGGTAAFLDFSKSPNKFLQAIQLPVLKTWGAFWGIVVHARYTRIPTATGSIRVPNPKIPSLLPGHPATYSASKAKLKLALPKSIRWIPVYPNYCSQWVSSHRFKERLISGLEHFVLNKICEGKASEMKITAKLSQLLSSLRLSAKVFEIKKGDSEK
jgi:ubiquinone/menaquinone biosynthesis methyltransferase